MKMKCIFNIGKNISILAKVTQVSDVAHVPLVFDYFTYLKCPAFFFSKNFIFFVEV
jgi:hypothetical protein